VHARRQRAGVDRPDLRRLAFLQRQLEGAVAAERRSAGVQIGAQRRDRPAGPDVVDRPRARVAEHAVAVGIGAAADDPAVAEHDERRPGPRTAESCREEVQRHAGRYFFVSFFMYASSLSFSYLTVLRNRLSAR